MEQHQGDHVVAPSSPITRRRFLAGGLAAAGALGTVGALGSGTSAASVLTRAVAGPAARKRGGTLVVGSLGSTTDSLDPNKTTSNMDLERLFNLYDTLTYFPHYGFDLQWGLAESIELSNGSTVATIRCRPGVTWHNGKPFTADDVMFSFQRMLNPKNPGVAAGSLKMINLNAMKKLDSMTLQLTLNYPDSIFPERFYQDQMSIVPVGFDPSNPVGTGPFMYKSFTPGIRSEFVRNPNYWMPGLPYLDELVIIDFATNTAQIDALLSGQVDAIDSVPLNETSTIKSRSNLKLLVANGGYFQPITMRVDVPPWTDNRVREAMRLIVNRPQMISEAYNGWGAVGNDMPCQTDPAYVHSLPQRVQDIDKAKFLLKAAGQADMKATFVTADEDYGLIPCADVFVQDCYQAGVTLSLSVIPASVYNPKFLKWPFTQGYYGNKPFGIMWASRYAPGGFLNDTSFDDAQANSIYTAALADTNVATRNDKFSELERILYERGGEILFGFRDTVDAYSTQFTGFTPDRSTGWSLGQYRFREVSLA